MKITHLTPWCWKQWYFQFIIQEKVVNRSFLDTLLALWRKGTLSRESFAMATSETMLRRGFTLPNLLPDSISVNSSQLLWPCPAKIYMKHCDFPANSDCYNIDYTGGCKCWFLCPNSFLDPCRQGEVLHVFSTINVLLLCSLEGKIYHRKERSLTTSEHSENEKTVKCSWGSMSSKTQIWIFNTGKVLAC